MLKGQIENKINKKKHKTLFQLIVFYMYDYSDLATSFQE